MEILLKGLGYRWTFLWPLHIGMGQQLFEFIFDILLSGFWGFWDVENQNTHRGIRNMDGIIRILSTQHSFFCFSAHLQ